MKLRTLALGIVVALAGWPVVPVEAACHAFSFTKDTYSVGEQAGSVTLTVQRDGAVADSSVKFHTVNGTAKAPQDYSASSGTIEYTGQQLSHNVEIAIENDPSDEPDEEFTVVLDGGGGCQVNPNFQYDSATVRIQDNDEKPVAQAPPTPAPTPTPKATKTPKPTPSSASPTPSPSTNSASPSPTPTTTASAVARSGPGDGGPSGGVLAAVVATALVLGAAAAFWVRKRFLA